MNRTERTSAQRRRIQRHAEAQNGICPWCSLPLPLGLTGAEVELDHIIPN